MKLWDVPLRKEKHSRELIRQELIIQQQVNFREDGGGTTHPEVLLGELHIERFKKQKEAKLHAANKLQEEEEAHSQSHKAVFYDELLTAFQKRKEAKERRKKRKKARLLAAMKEEAIRQCYEASLEAIRQCYEAGFRYSNDSTSTETDSPDSDEQPGGKKKSAPKKKIRNQEHRRWIDSWHTGRGKEGIPEDLLDWSYHAVFTDGYFRKGRRGGHGAIIRDRIGSPIVASAVAVAPADLVSYGYQQLQGVAKGIELAVENSLPGIQVYCNAKYVVRLVKRALQRRHCRQHSSSDVICKTCVGWFVAEAGEEYDLFYPLLKKIAEMVERFSWPFLIHKCSRGQNNVADYLAKNGAPGMEVLWPSDFPLGLQEKLCEEYFHGRPGLPISWLF